MYTVAWSEHASVVINWPRPRPSRVWSFDTGTRRQRAELRSGLNGQIDGTELAIVLQAADSKKNRQVVITAADGRQWFWQRAGGLRSWNLWRSGDTQPIYQEQGQVSLRHDATEVEAVLTVATRDLTAVATPWWWVEF
jgi:hypothetical protein